MSIITSTDAENAGLERLTGKYSQYSEMTLSERRFLNSLILRHKPKKILELGVSAGGSAVVILNAIKDDPDARLYSVDYSTNYYIDPRLKSGFAVDAYPELQTKHQLHTGGLALEFMEAIGGDIDFCFIDTMHRLPGELLDYLMVLPFLKPECVVVFHDTQLHTWARGGDSIATCLMMSAVKGQKLRLDIPFDPRNFETGLRTVTGDSQGDNDLRFAAPQPVFANIGGVILAPDAMDHVWDVLNILTLPWSYRPPEKDIQATAAWFERFYGADTGKFLRDAAVFQEYRAATKELGAIQGFGGVARIRFGLKSRCRELLYRLRSGLASGRKREKYARRAEKVRLRREELLRIKGKYAG